MSQLLKAFDSLNDFERTSYFALQYDALSSSISIDVPLAETKENIEKVLEVLNLANENYDLVFKHWNIEDTSDADFKKDFPYQLLYKSSTKKSIIWITLEDETASITFLYDCSDTDLENWIIDRNHLIRKNFGLFRTPTFKVLTKSYTNFHTENVRTEKVEIDVKTNYNDDFEQIFNKVEQAIVNKQSGLIMLYGKPGTGKTSYIKSLISKHQESNFIFVQNEFVNNLLDPDFISFLLKQRNSILIIEDAEKVLTSRESAREESVVSTILQLTDGLFSDYLNIKVVCTFNSNLSKVDTALLRKGRMIAMYEFKALSLVKTNDALAKRGFEISNTELTLSDIFNTEQMTYNNIDKNKIGF